MNTKKAFPVKLVVITCVVLFGIVVLAVFIRSICTAKDRLNSTDLDMFATIEECQQLETKKEAGAEIYSVDFDYALKDLMPIRSYCCQYTSDNMSFHLYAYEFAAEADAAAYFKNETGKDNQPVVTFSAVSNPLNYNCIVRDHEKVYRYYCQTIWRDAVTAYINDCFSVDLIDINSDK